MPAYAIENLIPVVDPAAFVHPTAVLIGDVIVSANCYVGPNAVLRGDFGRILLAPGSNVQDTCVLHSFPQKDCTVDIDGHIGHGAVLHGCYIGRNALVGINAVVMDDVRIGAESLIAACAFVKSGFECPPRSLLAGSPAQIRRQLTEEEVKWKSAGTREYQQLTLRSMSSLREIQPLLTSQADRPRFTGSQYTLKGKHKHEL